MNFDIKLPWPASDAHKYSRGKLILLAGSDRFPGAAGLAARAAQRLGAGYVELITAPQAVDVVRAFAPSLVVRPFSDWDINQLPHTEPDRPCAVCLGCGFVPGQAVDLVQDVLCHAACPVLIDGGALHNIASRSALSLLRDRSFPTVVTPHIGEAQFLSEQLMSADEPSVPTDPAHQASEMARLLNACVVLKGSTSYISDGSRTEVMDEGSEVLAKAGTGDILAGMIGALLAQGYDPFAASLTGSVVHAVAGERAARRLTTIAACPEDVLEEIPSAIKALS